MLHDGCLTAESRSNSVHPCQPFNQNNTEKLTITITHARTRVRTHTHTHTHTHNRLTAFVPGQPGYAGTRRNTHPLTPILIIGHPLSSSSIYNDQWHPLCSFYVLDSPLVQPLSRSSLVFLLVLDPQLHTPYISSPNHHLLFAAHAHTNAACSAAIPMLCHLYLVSLSTDHYNSCSLKCHHVFSLPCNMLLLTQLLYNLPLIIKDTSLLISSGTSCLNLFQPIRIMASTAASASPSTLSMSPR